MQPEAVSRTDWISPIVLRQLRRLVRSHTMTWTTLALLALSATATIVCLILIGVRPHDPTFAMFWSAAAVGPAQIFMFVSAVAPACMIVIAKLKDELLDLSFTPKQLVHGYVLLGIVLTTYFAAVSLPFLTLSFVFGGMLLTPLLGLLNGIFIGGVATTLVFFSFLAKRRSMPGLVVGVIVLYFFFSFFFAGPVFVETIFEVIKTFRYSMTALATSSSASGSFMPSTLAQNDWRLQGIVLFQTVLIAIAAYKLSLSHLAHPERSALSEIGRNILVYIAISLLVALLWAALRLSGVV